ncbi:MAG: hypothetical protein KF845_01565 [Cyclobacteriaceae bacterium]|nr:hypothetical protein [Cyclobacteriaceae bacterium]
MIITYKLPIHRIVEGTWKSFVFSILTCFAAYFINELWLKNYFSFPVFVPTVLGTALAFFIGFNNNQAYDRWWEARKIWGSLVNNSRTWARQILYYTQAGSSISLPELQTKKERLIKRHIAFLYALKAYLRDSGEQDYLNYLSAEEVAETAGQTNLHNAILSLQAKDLEWLYQNKSIDGFKFIEMNGMITAFCDDMGKSERIKNTIFPTTYNYYARGFIWFFIYSATMTIGNSIGIWAVVFGTLLGYVFFTIQTIGKILLNPFEAIPTGIPVDQITRTIEINLLEMMGEENIPEPVKSIDGEYIM